MSDVDVQPEALAAAAEPQPQPAEHIMQFFAYEHLPLMLQAVSRPFGELALELLALPRNPERSTALRKLLEARNAAVRARGQMSAALPRWRCHKQVEAVRITAIEETHAGALLHHAAETAAPVQVWLAYLEKHQPQVGGYYVRYADGYESYSPAKAFEGGYTLLADEP